MQPKHYKHVTDRITKVKCNAATCLFRPQHVSPKPDWIRQVSLYYQGYKPHTIERLLREEGLKASKWGIAKFIARFKADGVLTRRLGSGRLSKVTAEVKAIVEAQMRQDDETTAFQLHKLLVEKGYNISRRTILRCRRDLGWTFRGSFYCQLIRHANKVKRLEWAKKYKDVNFDNLVWAVSAQSSWRPTIDLLAGKEKSHQRTNQGLYWFLYIQ